ncbi:Mg2+ transporter like zinc transport [Fusarium mundagurra]|uniref:Mg2+ transporter like zinc transport n=1 Tax=Fusarium mundagurra TaxID=1567541 RepID=A0A8H5YXQ2_9HYPO|nr:Mg2+ transporter like zinc transport [Fusarium mundagurra]
MAQANPPDPMETFKEREIYYSFGDDGFTATVDTTGFLLQISRYFPDREHNTGYCVDAPGTDEPFFVAARIQQLYARATDTYNSDTIEPSGNFEFELKDTEPPKFTHDRWPNVISTTEEGVTLRTQYLVSDYTLFQTWELDYSHSNLTRNIASIKAAKGLLIRKLDFANWPNDFNNQKEDDETYETKILAEGKSLMRRHIDSGNPSNSVALFSSVFHDEEYLKFEKVEDDFQLIWSEKSASTFRETGRFKITTAYTLECEPAEDLPKIPPVSPQKFIGSRKRLDDCDYKPIKFADDPHLDFTLRRNLEHILSVCSIPVTKQGDQAIALTCGVMVIALLPRQVCNYSFQFLLQALRFLKSKDCRCGTRDESLVKVPSKGTHKPSEELLSNTAAESSSRMVASLPSGLSHEAAKMPDQKTCYVCEMLRRIKKTCRGHLIWLFKKASFDDHEFGPNYWVSGKKIKNNGYLPEKCLTDTPFHIIKVGEFYKFYKEHEDVDIATAAEFPKYMGISLEDIQPVIDSWIADIDKQNRMGLYAFPSHKKENYQTFYVTDHAFIWRAIKSAEDLGFQSRLRIPPTNRTQGEIKKSQSRKSQSASHEPTRRSYSSLVVQQNIQRRFTTENPINKKRMIAVSRSPVENRFLLRNRDASLFYAMDLGLFDKSTTKKDHASWREKVIDVWNNTLDCQAQHEDRDDTGWSEPLRFALSFIVARYGIRMNTRTRDEMSAYSKTVLLQSAYCSGLFPGALDQGHEPVMYQAEHDRDTYWGITFEIPYILWVYNAKDPKFQGPSDATHSEQSHERPSQTVPHTYCHSCEGILKKQLSGNQHVGPLVLLMKRSQPFNNVVYQENIVELSDEWLYNKPSFFGNFLTEQSVAPPMGSDQGSPLRSGTNADLDGFTNEESWRHNDWKGKADGDIVIDIPKSKKTKTTSKNPRIYFTYVLLHTVGEVKKIMERERTQEKAKKRFWYFRSSTLDPEGMCLHSFNAPSSSLPLSFSIFANEPDQFMKRHLSSKSFLEDTVPVLNSWITELQLSCFTLMDRVSGVERNFEIYQFPAFANGDIGKSLCMSMMSFRFEGDFFDRYWTCHFLETTPRKDIIDSDVRYRVNCILQRHPNAAHPNEGPRLSEADRQKEPWRQRRCLELLLFDSIISQMHKQAQEILEEAKRVIKNKGSHDNSPCIHDDPNKMRYRDFRGANTRYQKVQEILQALEGDLVWNLSKVDLWLNREKERQTERPRWTLNDESRYRGVIAKLSSSNTRRIQDLRYIRTDISNYNDSITTKLEMIRAGIDQRRAHDTQVFTYVTVVFLPLGFATGVFSMSEAPTNRTLYSMIATAAVVFVVISLMLALVYMGLSAKEVQEKLVSGYKVVARETFRPRRERLDEEQPQDPGRIAGRSREGSQCE